MRAAAIGLGPVAVVTEHPELLGPITSFEGAQDGGSGGVRASLLITAAVDVIERQEHEVHHSTARAPGRRAAVVDERLHADPAIVGPVDPLLVAGVIRPVLTDRGHLTVTAATLDRVGAPSPTRVERGQRHGLAATVTPLHVAEILRVGMQASPRSSSSRPRSSKLTLQLDPWPQPRPQEFQSRTYLPFSLTL